MTVRYRAGDPLGVPSGYEGVVPTDVSFPSCGIEDVDRALFKTLKEVGFQVSDNGGGNQRPVPIVFAVGEKWSMIKSGRALRDKNGTLILPLVTVRRTGIVQAAEDVTGRGCNQHVGELVVRKRLDERDRAYQNLVNKLGIVDADDVNVDDPADGALSSVRDRGEDALSLEAQDRALLAPKLGRNVWQIVTVPTPQFFTATYEMTLWAQYTDHVNQMLEELMSAYLPTGNRTLRLDADNGYWFVARFDESYAIEDNSDSSTGVELTRRCKLALKVPGYVLLSRASGVPNGLRSFVSAPTIAFALGGEQVDTTLTNGVPATSDPYEAADDPEKLLLLSDPGLSPKDRFASAPERVVVETVVDPFDGRSKQRLARAIQRSPATGETVYLPDDGLTLGVVSSK